MGASRTGGVIMDPAPVSGVLVLAGEKAIEESRLPDPAAAAAALAYACPGEMDAERSASEMRERPLLVSDRELMVWR
jgi:hypothetical protein